MRFFIKSGVQKAYSYIRFSTPEQAKGYSFQRQLEKTKDYAKRHELILDESLTIKDLGISGFDGSNVSKGALGVFLKAVEEGKISKGSVLIVESLDRLSRQAVTDHLRLFLGITGAGIKIVTLMDEMEYSEENLREQPYKLFTSLGVMLRANDESKHKQNRIRDSWQRKRDSGLPMTSQCPAWLELDKKQKVFKPIPERCRLVRRMFRLCADGVGKRLIAKTFNKEKIPVWGRGRGWHESYIQKILESPSVLGEFQHHRLENKKRISIGEPIKSYFPPIIQKSLFDKATRVRSSGKKFSGKAGKGLSNLFTGLAKSGYSGAPMVYVNKGRGLQDKYLVSDDARRGRGEFYIGWAYRDFETSFLSFVKGLDFKKLMNDGQDANVKAWESERDGLQNSYSANEKRIARLVDSIADTDAPPKSIRERIVKFETENGKIEQSIRKLEAQLNEHQENSSEFNEGGKRFKALLEKRSIEGFRFKLRQELREKISRIDVYPGGFMWTEKILENIRLAGTVERVLENFRTNPFTVFETTVAKQSDSNRIKPEHLPKLLKVSFPRKTKRFFVVYFKSGAIRAVVPNYEKPEKLLVLAEVGASLNYTTWEDLDFSFT